MDPLLDAMLASSKEGIPPWAYSPSAGRPSANNPEVAARRFAAPTPSAAIANNVRTGLEDATEDKTFAGKAARLVAKLLWGSPREETTKLGDNPQAAIGDALNVWNPVSGMVGMLAGKGAVGAPLGKLKGAMEAEAKGLPSQEIWRKYGWERGKDGAWRWEISDDAARLSSAAQKTLQDGIPTEGLLPALYEHPELYKAYPQLRSVNAGVSKGAFEGSYQPRQVAEGKLSDEAFGELSHELGRSPTKAELEDAIRGYGNVAAPDIRAAADSPQALLRALTHESQHGIQEIERFAPGGSPGAMKESEIAAVRSTPTSIEDLKNPASTAYRRLAGEVEARNAEARLADSDLRKFAPGVTEDVPRMLQTVRYLQETSPQLAVIKGPWKDRIVIGGHPYTKEQIASLTPEQQSTLLKRAMEERTESFSGTDKQIEAQMPRLEKLAEETFRTAQPRTLQGEPQEVTPLLKSVAGLPSIKSFLGQEEVRYGADVYQQGPYPFNLGGVSSEYASPEEARRAALIYVLNKLRASDPKGGTWNKSKKPQISEFASPESARKSWRILEGEE